MLKHSKRKLTILITILILIIIFLSTSFILSNNFKFKKSEINSNFILETQFLPPINIIEAEKIANSQYKSNNWRIQISKINLDAPILEGTGKEILRRGVGHFESSGIWNGNVCLAAHNRGYKYNYFQEIKKLEIGDVITYQTEFGERNYQVVTNEIIIETDWSKIENTKENKITLITCEENKKEYRRCVQAIEI